MNHPSLRHNPMIRQYRDLRLYLQTQLGRLSDAYQDNPNPKTREMIIQLCWAIRSVDQLERIDVRVCDNVNQKLNGIAVQITTRG